MRRTDVLSRRSFLRRAAGTAAAAIAGAPYARTARSAGRLSVGLWEHWVPGANEASRALVEAWGRQNGVEVSVDYLTSRNFRQALLISGEARARSGHDVMALPTWRTALHAERLEPVDDVVREIEPQQGRFHAHTAYLARLGGVWRSVPTLLGAHSLPMVSRLDYFKRFADVDLQALFPAERNRDPALVAAWNHENFLGHCERLFGAGHPFGNPIGPGSEAQGWLYPLFLSFGGVPVNEAGAVTLDSEGTRQALDYLRRLSRAMPPEVYGWDDGANDRWLVSGKGGAIQDAPEAWATAKRFRPEAAAQLWHHDVPSGPRGRFRGGQPRFLGLWSFSPNKSAGKALILHLSQKPQVERLISAARGYDLPPNDAFLDNPIWEEIGPPRGGQYNYPMRGDEQLVVAGYPAPPVVAARILHEAILPDLIVRYVRGGETLDAAIRWAVGRLEGIVREHGAVGPVG